MSRLSDKIGAFTTVPNSVIKLWPTIGVDGIALFLYLRFRTNADTEVCFPAYDTIRKDTTLTRTRIARAIRALEAAGVLERRRRFGGSTIYTLKVPEISPISPPVGLMDPAPLVQVPDSSSPPAGLSLVQQSDTNKIKFDQNNLTENGAPPRLSRDDYKRRVAAALERGIQRHEAGEADLSWLDEDLWALGRTFIAETGLYPIKSDHTYWRKSLRQQCDAGLTPENLVAAIQAMLADRLTIADPGSVTKTARALAASSASTRNLTPLQAAAQRDPSLRGYRRPVHP